ncbi:hypothetical protein ACXWP2_09525, partial [Streptococcus pyogenes]
VAHSRKWSLSGTFAHFKFDGRNTSQKSWDWNKIKAGKVSGILIGNGSVIGMGTGIRCHDGTGSDINGSNQTEKQRTFR